MTSEELQQQRRVKWRIAGQPVRTLDDAHAFITDVGMCLQYPQRAVLLPTFIGAWVGADDKLPRIAEAFADQRAKDATELMVRLLRERSAYEWPIGDNVLLVSASIFPFIYALASDRGGKQEPAWAAGKKLSKLSLDAWQAIERARQPLSRARLRDVLGATSASALDRALHDLWARLRITRVGYDERESAIWSSLAQWSPEIVAEGAQLSLPAALSALVSQYLQTVVAAEQAEIESFFSLFVARSKTRDVVNALLSAREIDLIHIGQQSMLQITPTRQPHVFVPRSPRQAAVVPRRPTPGMVRQPPNARSKPFASSPAKQRSRPARPQNRNDRPRDSRSGPSDGPRRRA
jgi:hypothetical protein